MPDFRVINNVHATLEARDEASITRWHRVRGVPRTHEPDEALRAEIRDPLWMLSRQWQMGELQGDDAGSPIFAKLHLATSQLTGYAPREEDEVAYDRSVPLETRVEQRPLSFEAAGQALSLDVRVMLGRHWRKLLSKESLDTHIADFRDAFPVAPLASNEREDALSYAHPESWQHRAAFARRAMDGKRWLDWLLARERPWDFTTLPPPLAVGTDAAKLTDLAERFLAWFSRLMTQPASSAESAWEPSRMEHRFHCSAPTPSGRKTLSAEEYGGGVLDWYCFDSRDSRRAALSPELKDTVTKSFIPVAVEFSGMANRRWWSFEDRRVNFAALRPSSLDLGELLMMEFGLVYSNDWCVVPVPLQAGSVAEVRGLAVTNVFGERLWIEPAGQAPEHSWQRFSMFQLSRSPGSRQQPDHSLLLLSTVPKVQQGPVLEQVNLIRDEMANMVWGIEATVPMPQGEGRAGAGVAAESRVFYERLVGAAPPAPPDLENQARAKFELMTSVPEHWIPFVPVHVPGQNREIQLQRASMPRLFDNDPAPVEKVRPRTSLLREGLDLTAPEPYFLFEEEVPRAGARATVRYQRTRSASGRPFVWLTAEKRVGRGEGSSALEFDRLVETKDG